MMSGPLLPLKPSGVSLEQILSACHWKSHNTFTQFYLKDVAFSFGASGGCSTSPPPNPKMRRYVNMYICTYGVYLYIMQKNPKNCDLLPLGSLFLMGLNSTLSFYSQSRSEKKEGGNVGRLPGNRLVLADLDLTGFSDPICSVYEFT